MRALVFALMLACGADRSIHCRTTCGLQVLESPQAPAFCARLQAAEDRIVSKLTQLVTVDARFADPCKAVRGWRVQVAGVESWDGGTQAVSGQTFCPDLLMVVNNEAPLEGSLAHEIVHAVQRCAPMPPIEEDYYHSNWGPMYRVLDEIGP